MPEIRRQLRPRQVPCLRRAQRVKRLGFFASVLAPFLCQCALIALLQWRSFPYLDAAHITLIIVAFGSIICLPWCIWVGNRAALHIRMRALDLHGRVCQSCAYELPDEESGTCPECGTAFTLLANQEAWGCAPRPTSACERSEASDRRST